MRRFTVGLGVVVVWLVVQHADLGKLLAQDAGLGSGGGGLAGDIFDAVDQGGGVGGGLTGGNAQGGGAAGDLGGLLDNLQPFEPPEPPPLPDPNDQAAPFVGSTFIGTPPEGKEFRHVGATRESLGFGSTGGSTGGGGRGAGGFGNAGGFRGAGGGGLDNGFRVFRTQSIRSRVVPAFRSQVPAPQTVASRFSRRISTLPTTRQFTNSINVAMRGREAVITGTAENQQQLDRIQRQLRLEPGVSSIVNQAMIRQ